MYNFIAVKKNIIYIMLIILTSILIFFSYSNFSKSSQVLSNVYSNSNNYNGYDFDFDGNKDDITLISTESAYSIQIKNSFGQSLLKSNETDYLLFDNSPSCYPSIYYIDLSRNKIPELIISGLKINSPAFYIFRWTGNSFEEVLFSQDNILGILDYNNSRTPKIVTSLSTKGDESTQGFIVNNKIIKNITFSHPKINSLGSIQKLIDLIQLNYEIDDAPGIFTSYIPSNELALLWNLDKLTYHYNFQKAYFYDASWDSNGKPTSLLWTLSFEKVDYLSEKSNPKEFILYVKTEIDELGEYKISSLKRN